ncbi:hypothetical protein DSC45_07450 [Streptomyces sp. YIM 130001]|uniref:SDR family oxidoreductase n=1 Tax=Streptomyces sp. YIM 130001 TaxID=2259644 RepID=UPI000E649592|nr:SDR family oxidoreductase [Streptomyces sp. YIM 130001]RII19830.1 hypothetical protein DSC45_07450 [Streptomyces sp. YIM 130001]
MRVFVTGASGFIGSAVVPDLLSGGHQVVALARSDSSAASLEAAGAEVVRGTLDDLETLRDAATASDGVIHLAFKHDIAFTGDFAGAAAADRRVVETFGEALAGSDRPLVIASGVPDEQGRVATERDGHASSAAADGTVLDDRSATAELTLNLSTRDVRSSVVRLPPTNHGEGDPGFIATLVQTARAKGVSGHIGDGKTRWPATHYRDSAHLFRLALENAPAGTTLHAVAEEGVPLRDIAEAIGRGLDLPVASIAPEDAAEHFGWLAAILAADRPTSSALTRELLDWEPTRPGLIADIEAGHYFRDAGTPTV